MAIPFYEEINNRRKNVNIALSDNEKVILKLIPIFFDEDGNICYSTNTNHYETNIKNHVIDALSYIHNDFISLDYSQNFIYIIYNNKLYFTSDKAYRYFIKSPRIKEEIERKTGLKLDTDFQPYKNIEYLLFYFDNNDYTKIEIAPTLEEKFNIYYDGLPKKIENYMDIKLSDVLNIINYNSESIYTMPGSTKGIYNKNALEILNQYIKIKRDIYKKIFSLGIKSDDIDTMIMRLLKILEVYRNIKGNCEFPELYKELSNDLLVMFLGYSKIESKRKKTITTSKDNIYEEFWNYILMGYEIVKIPKLIYNKELNDFMIYRSEDISFGTNREAEEELKKIKKYVPYDQWYKYLK